jgi:acetoin utilization deacetylase AcuC-like enzyme
VTALGSAAELLRRNARLLRSAFLPPRALFVYHPGYGGPERSVVDAARGRKVLEYLYSTGSTRESHLRLPRRADASQLALVHDPEYLANLDRGRDFDRVFGGALPAEQATRAIEQQRWMVGGTIAATRMALESSGSRVVVNLGGGLHHAFADHGEGFCLFNDVAIAIRMLRPQGFDGRVLVIDLDLHQGNGTRAIFAKDPSVFTFSVHATDLDTSRAVASLDVELGPAIGDGAYLGAVRKHLVSAVETARPELVFYVAGVDVANDDAIGSWGVTHKAIFARDRRVLEACRGVPLVWVLAGGYGQGAWRHSARSLAWLSAGYDRAIDSNDEQALDRFRTIRRQLPAELLTTEPANATGLKLDDVMGDLVGSPGPARFLGYYTAYGLEMALERYGLLSSLRERGFPRVEVIVDPDYSSGQLLRVTSAIEPHEILMELVVTERLIEPDRKLLAIEWLLLQNPRAQPTRPLLPEQRHPGLGLLKDVIGVLVMACERLGLDGLVFNPAHYHVARLARSFATFLDPEVEGRFRSAAHALEGLPLAAASRAVDDGRVVDEETGEPYRWRGEAMVVPSSDALKQELQGLVFETAVRAAARPFTLRDATKL